MPLWLSHVPITCGLFSLKKPEVNPEVNAIVTCRNHLCLNTCSLQITIRTTFLGRGHTSLPSAPSSWKTTGFFNILDLEGFGGGKGLTLGLGNVFGGTFLPLLVPLPLQCESPLVLKAVDIVSPPPFVVPFVVGVKIGGKRGIMGGISSSNLCSFGLCLPLGMMISASNSDSAEVVECLDLLDEGVGVDSAPEDDKGGAKAFPKGSQ